MARPVVSVLIDTYNHERFIEKAIVSVLKQDFPAAEREIIVVDDGSTDRTSEIIRKFEPQVRLLRKANGGQASAFNAGIPECSGEIIAFLDGDDWWAPGKLRAVVNALEQETGVGLIGHGITEVYEDGATHTELLRDVPRFRISSEVGARHFRMRKSFLGTSRMTFRSGVLKRIGEVPGDLTIQADEYLFTLGAVLSDVLVLREPHTFYRLHGSNAFQISDGRTDSLRRKQRVMQALANALRIKLSALGTAGNIAKIVIESVQTEADVIRLTLENGAPWETISAEVRNYRIMHEGASAPRWALKMCSLLPACVLPSRVYFSWRQRFTGSGAYRKVRQTFM
ncbi:MAG: glycosyltransferase family 2 protein, partial [Candidatus Acidiferrum sp.]